MKRLVFFCFTVLAVACFFSLKPRPYFTGEDLKKNHMEIPADGTVSSKDQKNITYLSGQEMIEKSLDQAKTVDEFESAFSELSSMDINLKLEISNQLLDEKKIFQRANSDKGLNQEEILELVEMMRKRQALNKLKLDRQLEQMRRKYL